jgi:hypothetical protein
MNTIYALLLITSTGISEGYTFNSMAECQAVASKIKQHESVCVEKKVTNPDAQMKQMMSMFKGMVAEMKDMQK